MTTIPEYAKGGIVSGDASAPALDSLQDIPILSDSAFILTILDLVFRSVDGEGKKQDE